MRIKVGALRRLIEQALLAEDENSAFRALREAADEDDEQSENENSSSEGASIDAQIDRYLIQYEKAAGKKQTSEARSAVRNFLLREAEDEEAAEDKEAQLPADVGSETSSIDIESFASSVARLIESFDSLVEIRSSIVKRAEDFLRKTHDDEDVDRFIDSMRDQHGINPDETQYDSEADLQAPPAVGAGVPAGGGV